MYHFGYLYTRKTLYLHCHSKENKAMLVISSREFRANTGKYLDLVSKGQDVILRSRHLGSFRLTPVADSDGVMSEQEFYAKIDHSIKQAKEGKLFCQREGESAGDFVDRLLVLSTYGHYI